MKSPKRRRYKGRLRQGEPKAELSDNDRSLAGVGFPWTFVDVIETQTVIAFPLVVKDDVGWHGIAREHRSERVTANIDLQSAKVDGVFQVVVWTSANLYLAKSFSGTPRRACSLSFVFSNGSPYIAHPDQCKLTAQDDTRSQVHTYLTTNRKGIPKNFDGSR